MHGFSSGSTFLVNAEVDSMGGVVDGGVGIGAKPSPRRAAIEKAQAELRLEYDVREERRRELEFLEKGGNPLDFKFGHASSLSVQSTSQTDQHPDQNLTSEAKGSFALTPSPRGDSVESSGRLGATTGCEPNSADNFDGENEILQNVRKSMHTGRGSISRSEHSSQLDRNHNVKESEDSPIFHPKKGQAYRRRNRSRTNRDGPRSSSADMGSRGGHGSIPGRHELLPKPVASENQFEMESDRTNILYSSMTSRANEFAEGKLNESSVKAQLEEVRNPGLKPDEPSVVTRTVVPDIVDVGCPIHLGAEKTEDNGTSTLLNVTSSMNGDDKIRPVDAPIKVDPVLIKGLDSESSCTQNNLTVDGNGNFDCDLYSNLKAVDSNGTQRDIKLPVGENSSGKDDTLPNEKHTNDDMETDSCTKEEQVSVGSQGTGFTEKDHSEVDLAKSPPKQEAMGPSDVEELAPLGHVEKQSEKELGHPDKCITKIESSCGVRSSPSVAPFPDEISRNDFVAASGSSESQACTENQPKTLDKAQEDRILEEARMIEAKRKRIAELSIGLMPKEHRRKSHWDFVVEEMAWLANDFAQERLWKMTAAAQICHRVAFASRMRLGEQSKSLKLKSVAHTLAKAVMEFWQSARLSAENCRTADSSQQEKCNHEAPLGSEETILTEGNAGILNEDKASYDALPSAGRKQDLAVHKYAVKFLQLNCSSKPIVEVEVHETPFVSCDIDHPDVPWQDQLTEESLFYVVPPGAMEMYRKSIESCLADCEKFGSVIQEEVDKSAYNAAVEAGYHENDYEEDEGENLYPGPTGKPSKKKRKSMKSYVSSSYECGGDYGYGHYSENKNILPQSGVIGKRPANNLLVDPIPTKRMRTAPRPRVVGPFNPGLAGVAPVLSRADGSSGDTNSFQDDLSTLHGGSIAQRGSEVNSSMNTAKQTMYDYGEISVKPKKKKKNKHPSAYWLLDPSMPPDQKDFVRKRLEVESNGHSGLVGQHPKKPKFTKVDSSFDNSGPLSGSIASPTASSYKIIKLIGGRDRARKSKGFKVSTGQLGSGSPWTIVEDQALVVLVHDMGPNWELVSDAMNSILQFKSIFRTPQECKERHKFLMDRPSGDGADSAEDSGSSQPYPSTLPGIPKGSARQLFRSLHAALEEDNIKSRFEKIIHIEQQLHCRKKQGDNQDLKHIAPVHSSHVVAFSQVIPNNVNGGVLTPLDLCDIGTSNLELSTGYSSHPGGFQLPNQGSISSMHSPGGLNSPLQGIQGSPSMGIGNNMASPSSQFTSSRDARYAVPRSSSLPVEEQQRLHQYNSMLPGRNVPPSNLSSSGSVSANDRAVRMLPGGNGVGMMPGMNRPVQMARPGLQGIPSSSMMNSGNVLTSNVGGMPNNLNVHSGAAASQGNTMFRPRDSLHMVRPGQSSEHQRQMVLPEAQMQATQTNGSGVPPFSGLSSGYSNQTASPPLQSYHHHQQQTMPQQHPHVLSSPHSHLPTSNHSPTAEQAAYIRIARERQLQQRLLQRQHQQQQHPASNALMTHAQTSAQLPLSSPLQNSSQLQSSSSQSLSLASLNPSSPFTPVSSQSQQQQKHHLPSQGLGRSAQSGAGGMMNQMGKQRQRQGQQLPQQYQQSGRQHPQQRQQSQSQQSKPMKGVGRSNMLLHETPVDHLNGLSANTGSQVAEKVEPALPLVQGQGLYSGSGLSTLPVSKSLSSSTQPKKPCANTGPASSKSAQHLDNGNQGQSPATPSTPAVGLNQSLSTTVSPSINHQQFEGQPHSSVKMVNQSQPTFQRSSQQNRLVNSDLLTKSRDHSQAEQLSSTVGGMPTCVDSSSAVSVLSSSTRKVQEPVCDSSVTSVSSSAGPGSTQAVTDSLGNDRSPPANEGLEQRQLSGNLVSHGHGSQWQPQPSQLELPSLAPILPQKQSQLQLQQLDQPPLKVPQPQIHSGQSVHTNTTNSRLE